MSLPQPPQPRATANLIFWIWRVTLAAMDGGAFVASPSVGNIGKARRAARQTPSYYPPLPPYYFLIVVWMNCDR